jgi:hypothetical protein
MSELFMNAKVDNLAINRVQFEEQLRKIKR